MNLDPVMENEQLWKELEKTNIKLPVFVYQMHYLDEIEETA